ncbi:phage head-tail adapter protein [Ruminococcus sp.]|uniref:phage head-tail adapter protein n=1 Tax=Ruminococcus sp. TaxID=41978 RepID=UPI0025D7DF7E|nr:phage head-tail adapter protein [Ruminococcus sp.]MCR4639149.1 phage head-tail adapter protein [Ruminococcus sp.]
MNKEWSELNKAMQMKLKKKDSYISGIETLYKLREQLMYELDSFKTELSRNGFDSMPFINANGYHSKNIAYSLWHIFRIEDIVAHTLINSDEQVFFIGDYQKRINSPIITTGNELLKHEISEFSSQLNIDELYNYIHDVKDSTESIIADLSYNMMKYSISSERRNALKASECVSKNESAVWLIDYWCSKDIRGLIQMPFSRHWIMHTEAAIRIKNKIQK